MPVLGESKHPIEEETVEICTKDVDKYSSDKPETLIEWEIVTEKWFKEMPSYASQ
jgi:hypothetical protein